VNFYAYVDRFGNNVIDPASGVTAQYNYNKSNADPYTSAPPLANGTLRLA
jgi:hypothetical protein